MGSVLSVLLSYLLLYKYTTLFVVVFISAIVVPLPVNAMLLAVGAFSGQGYFNFWFAVFLAIGANLLGDLVDYGLARKYGAALIRKFAISRFRFFTQLEAEVRETAFFTVFVTRFASSLGPVVSVLAGAAAMPVWPFISADVVGNGIEIVVVVSLGYILGSYWQDFSGVVGAATGIIVVAVILFLLVRVSTHMAVRNRAEKDSTN